MLPSPLAPRDVRTRRSPRTEFDEIVLAIVDRIRAHRPNEMERVEVGVEDYPLLPNDWSLPVPYSSCVRTEGAVPDRLVLFRRPLVTHSRGRADLTTLIFETVVDELATLWGVDPDEIDPTPH